MLADIASIPRCQEVVKRKMKKIVVRRKNVDEGITDYLPSMDSVSAFGRNVADTATFGTYKYARAGADYVAKKALKATGLSKKDTTYSRELDQEKEKLAKDDIKHPQASAVGDIAGTVAQAVAPGIPGVGAAMKGGETASKIPSYLSLARRAIGLKENLAGAGTSADGGMSAPFSAMGQEVIARRKEKPVSLGKNTAMGTYVDEEMTAGGGGVAALGVGPQGEPGRSAKFMPTVKRGKPFLGVETYLVPSKVFNQIREAKRKGKHWRRYLDEDDTFHHIRAEARKNKNGAIIIEDEYTGALCFARYGKEV